MLEHENQIFLDVFHEDGLLIMSKGLGISRIFSSFLKVYCDPSSLVFVLNTTSADESYFTERLEKDGISVMPKIITNELNANDRQATYVQGGVQFITSRILVVDLLTDRVPVDHVTGILVYKAHKIIESCQEAFILRLYRQKNKTGFIKAFTDSPESFTSGFCQVEKVMKNLFVKKLYLIPRFHASVVNTMSSHKIDVVEVHQTMTPAMTACQTALLDLINACVNELKRSTPTIDTDEVTVENALSKAFDLVIRLQLDPVWHQLSARTRQLVADLKTLRLILRNLTQYDCVTFYSLLQSISSSERSFGKNSGWLFLDSTNTLIVHAKQRVFGNSRFQTKKSQDDGKQDQKTEEEDEDNDDEKLGLETCPKWGALSEILAEIAEEEESCTVIQEGEEKVQTQVSSRTLVCAEDDRTCNQLREYLCGGKDKIMNRLFAKYQFMKGKHEYGFQTGKVFNKNKFSEKPTTSETAAVTLTQMLDPITEQRIPTGASNRTQRRGLITSPITLLHPLHGCSDSHSLSRALAEVQPKYVILYDPEMSVIRQLEIYKASRPGKPLRVYFMMYQGSVEEQRYLTSLRKEKEAFEYLIREKSTMVISEEQDGKSENEPSTFVDPVASSSKSSSRQGGVQTSNEKQRVIVDMREFRSELPSLIHRRGIDIEPVTIEVGDYILTPEICVERKSINDLIGSLNSGRLYQQALSMSRFYKKPMLLIEFDSDKPFFLQFRTGLSNEVSANDVTSKLAMLTIHFPKLRLLWSPSPYASAELFQELKEGKEQPTCELATSIKESNQVIDWTDKYNHGPQDFVLRMPGVTSKNVHGILNKFTNIHEVCQASLDELSNALGSSVHAKRLHEFIHKERDIHSEMEPLRKKGKLTLGKGKTNVGKSKGVKRKK